MGRVRQLARDFGALAVIASLLAAVYLLPPDTSLAEIRRAGTLRVCAPPSYPPLVTGDPAAPGIDVELLRAVAADLGVELSINQNAAMGRDFNPRGWRLTRAQCHVLAGGVIDSPMTRSFLDVTPAHGESGWATIAKQPIEGIAGSKVGVLVGVSGLDRIALSRYLRDLDVEPVIVSSPAELTAGLSEGRFDVAVTEALLADWIAARHGWSAAWLDGGLERYPVVFGLWKGDLTLKRGIGAALGRLAGDGRKAAILGRYLGRQSLIASPGSD